MLARTLAVIASLSIGWVVYMIGVILTVYDGILSLVFQPIVAALVSAAAVTFALLVGQLLRIPVLSRWWSATALWAAAVAGLSLFVLAFGYFLGLTYVGTHPETGKEIVVLHPAAAVVGYFFLLFAVANWPVRRADDTTKPV